jgi:hypothetical protein
MKEIFDIRLIRLKTGEDLIAFCFEDYKNNRVVVKYAKTFYPTIDVELNTEELILVDWMPKEAFPIQQASIPADHVLFTSYSTTTFGYRYLDSILDEVDPDSDLAERIRETIEDSVVPDGTTLH